MGVSIDDSLLCLNIIPCTRNLIAGLPQRSVWTVVGSSVMTYMQMTQLSISVHMSDRASMVYIELHISDTIIIKVYTPILEQFR